MSLKMEDFGYKSNPDTQNKPTKGIEKSIDDKIGILNSHKILFEKVIPNLDQKLTELSNISTGSEIYDIQLKNESFRAIQELLDNNIQSLSLLSGNQKKGLTNSVKQTQGGGMNQTFTPNLNQSENTTKGEALEVGNKENIIDRLDLYLSYLDLKQGDNVRKTAFISHVGELKKVLTDSPFLSTNSKILENLAFIDTQIKVFAKTGKIEFTDDIINRYNQERKNLLDDVQKQLDASKENFSANIGETAEDIFFLRESNIVGSLLPNGLYDRFRDDISELNSMSDINTIVSLGESTNFDYTFHESDTFPFDGEKYEEELTQILMSDNEMLLRLQSKMGVNNVSEVINKIKSDLRILKDDNENFFESLENTFNSFKSQLSTPKEDYTITYQGVEKYIVIVDEKPIYLDSELDRTKVLVGNMLFLKGLAQEPTGDFETVGSIGQEIINLYETLSIVGPHMGEGMGTIFAWAGIAVNITLLLKNPEMVGGLSNPLTKISSSKKESYRQYKKSKKDEKLKISEKNEKIISENSDLFDDIIEREKLLDDLIAIEKDQNKKNRLKAFKKKFLFIGNQKSFLKTFYDFHNSLEHGKLRRISNSVFKTFRTKTFIGAIDVVNLTRGKKAFGDSYDEYFDKVKDGLSKKLDFSDIVSDIEKLSISESQQQSLIIKLKEEYTSNIQKNPEKKKGFVEKVNQLKEGVEKIINASENDKLGNELKTAVGDKLGELLDNIKSISLLEGSINELQSEIDVLLGLDGNDGLIDRLSNLDASLQAKAYEKIKEGIKDERDVKITNIDQSVDNIIKVESTMRANKVTLDFAKNIINDQLKQTIGLPSGDFEILNNRLTKLANLLDTVDSDFKALLEKSVSGTNIDWSIMSKVDNLLSSFGKEKRFTQDVIQIGKLTQSSEVEKLAAKIEFLEGNGENVDSLKIKLSDLRKLKGLPDITPTPQPGPAPQPKPQPTPAPDVLVINTDKLKDIIKNNPALSGRSSMINNRTSLLIKINNNEKRIAFDLTDKKIDAILNKLENLKTTKDLNNLLKMGEIEERIIRPKTNTKLNKLLQKIEAQRLESMDFVERAKFELRLANIVDPNNSLDDFVQKQVINVVGSGNEIDVTVFHTLVGNRLKALGVPHIRETKVLIIEVAKNYDNLNPKQLAELQNLIASGNLKDIRSKFKGTNFVKKLLNSSVKKI